MIDLSGLTIPNITPKFQNKVDQESLKKLINFLLQGRVDSIFVLGTTGEFCELSLYQKKSVAKTVIEKANKLANIFVGVSGKSIEMTLELMFFAESAGADAVVITPMMFESIEKDLATAIGKSSLPVILYNNPFIHDGKNLPIEIIEQAKTDSKVLGIKDSSGNWEYFKSLLAIRSDKFKILQGDEQNILQSLEEGAAGLVSGTANTAPGIFKELFTKKSPQALEKALAVKKGLEKISPNYILAIKQKLVKLDIIRSAEMFN